MYLNRIHTATFLPFRAHNTDNQLIIDTLSKRIEKYQENVFSEDAITQYKKRYKKMKEGNVKKRNKS